MLGKMTNGTNLKLLRLKVYATYNDDLLAKMILALSLGTPFTL